MPALDGLRAIAIAGVFGLHAARPQFSGGGFGVDLFFTLSAFLITSLVLDEIELRRGRFSFRGFYWRRVLRLGPALLLWVCLLAIPESILDGEGRRVPQSVGIVLTYTNDFLFGHLAGGFGQSWSLAVEEQFYLVWPATLLFAYRYLTRRARRGLLLAAIPAATMIMIGGIAWRGANANYFWPSGHLIPIMLGCLAADYVKYGMPSWVEAVSRRTSVAVASLLVLLALIVGFRFVGGNRVLVPATLVIGLASALLILHAATVERSLVTRSLTLPPMRWMGRRSYGMYLYGLTLLGLFTTHFIRHEQVRYVAAVALVVSFVVVDLSFRFIETPILRRKWVVGWHPPQECTKQSEPRVAGEPA